MARAFLYAGIVLIIFGISAFTGIIPLSGLNTTVTISGLSAACSPSPSASLAYCSGKATLTNTNSSAMNAAGVYMTVANQKLQQVAIGFSNVNLPPNTPTSVTVTLGSIAIGSNYTLTAFVINSKNWVVSPNAVVQFGTGSVSVTIDDPGTSGTITPSPGTYTYQLGQSLTLNFVPSATCTFGSWVDVLGGYTSASNPLTIKVWRNFEFAAQLSQPCGSQSYTITPQVLGTSGSISPSAKQSIYNPSYGGSVATSATFTATAGTNWYFSHWNLMVFGPPAAPTGYGANVTSALGGASANPVTVTYTALSSVVQVGQGLALQAIFVQGFPLSIAANAGVATTPPAGVKYYAPGSQVTVSDTVSTGWCWTGMVVDGVNQGASKSTTVTMNGAHTVVPTAYQLSVGQSCSGPPPPPPLNGNTGWIIGAIALATGVALVFVGLRKRR